MARNIELKARIHDIDNIKQRIDSLVQNQPEIIKQQDIFFNCDAGRLKLRIFSEQSGQLIFYQRANKIGPKLSNYYISHTQEPDQLLALLEKSHGIKGVVNKVRNLFLLGRTRIHLDHVEQLGDFIELEVVLKTDESMQLGENEAKQIMAKLGIQKNSLIEHAYIDLILQKSV